MIRALIAEDFEIMRHSLKEDVADESSRLRIDRKTLRQKLQASGK